MSDDEASKYSKFAQLLLGDDATRRRNKSLRFRRNPQVAPETVNRVIDYGFRAYVRRRQSCAQTPDDKHDLLRLERSSLPDAPPAEQITTYLASPQSEYKELADALIGAMVVAEPDDTKLFLPLGALERICQESVVRRELMRKFRNSSPELIESYTKYVCDDSENPRQRENISVKLFAILVLMEKLHLIGDLIEAGIKDRHLPLKKSQTKEPGDSFVLVKRKTTDDGVREQITCCHNWPLYTKQEFYSAQWCLLSPFFDKAEDGSVVPYDLDAQVIMPWTTIGEPKRSSVPSDYVGTFAEVRRVTIHKDHHAFDAQSFAIKTFVDDGAIYFGKELQNLKKIEGRFHLLPAYAAYQKGLEYSFILPWADGGSLNDFWKRHPQSLRSQVFLDNREDTEAQREKLVIRWIARQMVGLTGEFGLGFIHDTHFPRSQLEGELNVAQTAKRYGIHGDIEPGNILHFEQDGHEAEQDITKFTRGLGHLKISCFSATEFYSAPIRSQELPNGPHSPTYRAPEYGSQSIFLSEKYDIWSLGCVMLQFLTWFIDGPEGLRYFDHKRYEEKDEGSNFMEDKFFKISGSGVRTHKSSVENHIKDLQKRVGQGNYLHGCLVLIWTKMLQLDPKKRGSCEEISAALQECYEEYELVESSPPLSVDGESSSAPPSVFSLPEGSIASSMSSRPEILAAVFLKDMLMGDPELQNLFKSAFEDPKIGGERLKNNFRRILKFYSRDLRMVATDEREQLASEQVRKNARSVAQLIKEAYDRRPKSITADLKSLDDFDARRRIENYLRTMSSPYDIGSQITTEPVVRQEPTEDSSDSENSIDGGVLEKEPDDHTSFPNLQHVKAFLTSGDPMAKLRENLKSFVHPTSPILPSNRVAETRRIWLPHSVPEMVGVLFDLFKIPIPEDPELPGMTRVRWKCQCGTQLYDDFPKLTPEGLNATQRQLAQNEHGTGGPTPSSVGKKIRGWAKGISDGIAQRVSLRPTSSKKPSTVIILYDKNPPQPRPQVEDRQILLCIDIGEENMARLFQPSLSDANVSNDEELFVFLRDQYWKCRTTPRFFTLRCVKRVWITKFDVDRNDLVELKHPGSRDCKPDKCMCLPPLARIEAKEYVCSPAPEEVLQQHPVYSPRRLKHYFEKPHQFKNDEKHIYQQLPKRKSQLTVDDSAPCIAWGLHFEEDWHWATIIIYVSVSVFGSLLFGIIWSATMKEVGDGFTAGSFGLSVCSVLLALAAWRSASF